MAYALRGSTGIGRPHEQVTYSFKHAAQLDQHHGGLRCGPAGRTHRCGWRIVDDADHDPALRNCTEHCGGHGSVVRRHHEDRRGLGPRPQGNHRLADTAPHVLRQPAGGDIDLVVAAREWHAAEPQPAHVQDAGCNAHAVLVRRGIQKEVPRLRRAHARCTTDRIQVRATGADGAGGRDPGVSRDVHLHRSGCPWGGHAPLSVPDPPDRELPGRHRHRPCYSTHDTRGDRTSASRKRQLCIAAEPADRIRARHRTGCVPEYGGAREVGALRDFGDACDRGLEDGVGMSNVIPLRSLTHLERLESESMHIMREVVAETERPVMLYSVGKDSAVMLHLARKAFFPAPPPFPLLHVDTTWKFKAMYEMRDRMAAESGMQLLVHRNPEAQAKGINPFDHGSLHTDMWKTEGLKQALEKYRFDAAFGGARRDEEKSRAKERVFSFRSANHRWDPKSQRPELWNLYNTRKAKGESIRVFPISNWTELDIWQYIHLEDIPIVPLYFADLRPTVERDGLILMVDDERFRLNPGEVP